MKFTTDTKELKNLLEIHKKVTPGSSMISALSGIAFKAIDSNILQISNTNLETTIISVINTEIEGPGTFIVPLKTAANIITCNDDKITNFELLENNQCRIDKMKVNTFAPDEYPELPPVDVEKSRILHKLNFTDFITAASKIIKFASTEESRAILTGVLFDTTNRCLVGTDSYRLGKSFYCFNKDVGKFIVPGHVVKLLANIYKQFKTEIFNIILEDEQITFKIANITVISRLLNGKYPEYEQLIPQDFNYQYEINSKELIKCIDKAKKLIPGDIPIKINFDTVKADITASDKEIGSYKDIIKVNTIKNNNDEFLIAFNPVYLKEGIEQFEDFNFYGNDPLKPAVMQNNDNFLFLLMPIRVQ
jgi:DNA polymerase III subunit beta